MFSLSERRDFLCFLVANTVEKLAAAGMTVLMGYQIYQLTHNPLNLGWLGLIEAVPGVTLVLYGGHFADEHSRRRIIVVTCAILPHVRATTPARHYSGCSSSGGSSGARNSLGW